MDARDQQIARVDGRALAVLALDGGPAAPKLRVVGDIVVNQRGQMRQLHHRAEQAQTVQAVLIIRSEAAAQEQKPGAEHLVRRTEHVVQDFPDGGPGQRMPRDLPDPALHRVEGRRRLTRTLR